MDPTLWNIAIPIILPKQHFSLALLQCGLSCQWNSPAQVFHKEVHLAGGSAGHPGHLELGVAVRPGAELVEVGNGEERAVDLLPLDHELQEVPHVAPHQDGAALGLVASGGQFHGRWWLMWC